LGYRAFSPLNSTEYGMGLSQDRVKDAVVAKLNSMDSRMVETFAHSSLKMVQSIYDYKI
jgi:hypothetical protein